MKRKLIFSARYTADAALSAGFGGETAPERWAAEFQAAGEDRTVLADPLVGMARHISMTGEIDMDIYASPGTISIDLYLDQTLYFKAQMQQLAALLLACDSLCVWQDQQMLLMSLTRAREPM